MWRGMERRQAYSILGAFYIAREGKCEMAVLRDHRVAETVRLISVLFTVRQN